MFRFLASGRWIGWLVMVCIFAAVCAGLGKWQWDRRAEVAEQNRQVSANWDAAPVPQAEGLPWFSALPPEREYTPVTLRGEYLPQDTRLIRQRSFSGGVGMEVLVPFRTTDGSIVAVDRGWLPTGNTPDQRPDAIPAPPTGAVQITVRLKTGEPNVGKDAPEGQLASIELPAAASSTGLPLATGAYGLLAQETPAPQETPRALPKPEKDEGMHWSYALQWAAFGVLFFVGFGYAARMQAKHDREDREEAAAAAARGEDVVFRARRAPRAKVLKPRRDGKPRDEDVEDALLDAEAPER